MAASPISEAAVGGIPVLAFVSVLLLPVSLGYVTPFGMPIDNIPHLLSIGLPVMGIGIAAYWIGSRYEFD